MSDILDGMIVLDEHTLMLDEMPDKRNILEKWLDAMEDDLILC